MIKTVDIPIESINLDWFLSYIDIPNNDGCWFWIGSRNKKGYGRFTLFGKSYQSHRAMFAIATCKQIPSDLFVCHICDTPSCVKPSHLFLGTAKDNSNDCVKKGRLDNRVGSNNHNSVLCEYDVDYIRKLWSVGFTAKQIFKHTGVSEGYVYSVVYSSSNRWKNVDGYGFDKHKKFKLTHDSVLDIRTKYLSGNYTQESLSKEYNVSQSHIGAIVTMKKWKRVAGVPSIQSEAQG